MTGRLAIGFLTFREPTLADFTSAAVEKLLAEGLIQLATNLRVPIMLLPCFIRMVEIKGRRPSCGGRQTAAPDVSLFIAQPRPFRGHFAIIGLLIAYHKTMFALFVLGLVYFACFVGGGVAEAMRKSVVCQTDLDEPTILEILQSALPGDIRKGSNELFDRAQSAKLPLNWKLPLASFFSQGEYRITFESKDPSFTFKDIEVYEESFSNFSILCNIVTHYLPVGKGLCACGNADKTDASLLPPTSASYCSLPSPCDTTDFQNRLCKVNVDPFRKSCLVITSHKPIPAGSVSYTKHTPALSDMISTFIPESLTIESVQINQGLIWLSSILQFAPLHLICLLVGLYVTVNARDLAESQTVQTFIQATVGLFLATVLLLFILYRPIERIVSRYTGVATMLFPFSIVSTVASAVYRNPWVAKQIFILLVDFW
ncbi:hypothetical protein EON65_34890 [archaeon]|nr:MAG: hypothetical protein EON65_34890 [archaeon]